MYSRLSPGKGTIRAVLAIFSMTLFFCGACRGATVRVISGGGRNIHLAVGKSVIIKSAAAITRVSSADDKVATVTAISPTQVLATGKSSGVTTITLWQGKDKVAAVYDVEVAADVLSISNKIHRLFPGERGLRIVAANDSLTLAGTVSNAVVLSQVLALAEAYGGQKKVINDVRVSGVQEVMLKVHVAEMQRTLLKQLTIDFIAMAGGSQGVSMLGNLASIAQTVTTSSPLNLNVGPNTNALFHIAGSSLSWTTFLNALHEDGLAKILAEPTLVAVSGQTASFLAGGEFPVPIPQGLGTVGIEYKKYGVQLTFTPTVLDDDRISMRVAPTVSELDFQNQITIQGVTVPALTTRSVQTVVELGDGQSFAIAGLLQDNITEDINKYPWLGDVPVLGTLFRSSQFKRNQTELVVIVTPHLVKPLNVKELPLPTDGYVEPSDSDFFLKGLLQGCQTASPPPICREQNDGLQGDFGHAFPRQ